MRSLCENPIDSGWKILRITGPSGHVAYHTGSYEEEFLDWLMGYMKEHDHECDFVPNPVIETSLELVEARYFDPDGRSYRPERDHLIRTARALDAGQVTLDGDQLSGQFTFRKGSGGITLVPYAGPALDLEPAAPDGPSRRI